VANAVNNRLQLFHQRRIIRQALIQAELASVQEMLTIEVITRKEQLERNLIINHLLLSTMTVTNRESGKTAIKSGECAIGTSKLGSTGRKFTVSVLAVLFLRPLWRLTCPASRATTRWAPISILG